MQKRSEKHLMASVAVLCVVLSGENEPQRAVGPLTSISAFSNSLRSNVGFLCVASLLKHKFKESIEDGFAQALCAARFAHVALSDRADSPCREPLCLLASPHSRAAPLQS